MAKTTGTIRSEVILRMKAALKSGQSASAFIKDMQGRDLSYRRQDMLADWRSENNIKAKEGLLKYVRKDYKPTPAVIADVSWQTSREYMFKVKVQSRLSPGEPLTERFVNIMSDRPLTPRELESEVIASWGTWYPEQRQEVTAVIPETAMHRLA